MPRKDLAIITITYLSACAIYYIWMISMTQPGFPLDDSWIHQVFARNIATGHGFAFNPNRPIAASTAPLWSIILAIPWTLFGPIAGGMITGMIFAWLALIAVYKLTGLLTGDKNLPLLVGILTILCWPVVWGALSGMEIGLYSALSLWGIYFYFKSRRLDDIEAYLAYALFVLAFLSRPECVLFMIAFLLRDLFVWRKSKEGGYKVWLFRGLILFIATAPYFSFNIHTVASLFPNTYAAKVQDKGILTALLKGDLNAAFRAVTFYPYYFIQDFYIKVWTLNPIVMLALIPGFIKLVTSSREDRSKKATLVILLLAYIPLMGMLAPNTYSTFQNFRFITNLLPIMIMIGAIGLLQNHDTDLNRFKRPMLIIGSVIILAGLLIGIAFGYHRRIIGIVLGGNISTIITHGIALLNEQNFRYPIGTAFIGALFWAGFLVISLRFRRIIGSYAGRRIIIALVLLISSAITIARAATYANNVRNINEFDVSVGKYLGILAAPGDIVAVNDIGAIGYYSDMEIFDLWALISPEVTPEMINEDSLLFECMDKNVRVDYLAVVEKRFDFISKRPDIFQSIAEFTTENNTIVIGSTTIVYKTHWPDTSFQNSQSPWIRR